MNLPTVAAVITTVGVNPEHLPILIQQVRGQIAKASLQIVLVNNDPRVQFSGLAVDLLLEPGMNLGYAGALQFAREQVEAEFFWVIQDDMELPPDILNILLQALLETPRCAVSSPVLATDSGRIDATSRGGFVTAEGQVLSRYPSKTVFPEQIDESEPLNWVPLSGAVVRTAAWDEVGGLDLDFFPLRWVDVDFGFSLVSKGWSLRVISQAAVLHGKRGSTPTVMKTFLEQAATERFVQKHSHGVKLSDPDPRIRPESVARIAQSATLAFLDFGRYAAEEIAVLTKQVGASDSTKPAESRESGREWEFNVVDANLEIARLSANLSSMRNSMSWKVTKPIRSLIHWVHRRSRRQL